MNVLQYIDQLCYVKTFSCFRELNSSNQCLKLSPFTVIHDQIEVRFTLESALTVNDTRVVNMFKNLLFDQRNVLTMVPS